MAKISNYKLLPGFRHFRGDQAAMVFRWKKGKLVAQGSGLSFFFRPLNTQVVQVPVTDMELPFNFHARSLDYQDIFVEGTVTYRVRNPQALSERVNFSLDLGSGIYAEDPEAQIDSVMSQVTQELAWGYLANLDIADCLRLTMAELPNQIQEAMADEAVLNNLTLQVVDVRLTSIRPKPELERSLQARTLEALQQEADEAQFGRRARVAELERSVSEAELNNRIALEEKNADLIGRQNTNQMAQVTASIEREEATATAQRERQMAEAETRARTTEVQAQANAEATAVTEAAKNAAEKARLDMYAQAGVNVMAGVAAREFANSIAAVGTLTITPDLFTRFLSQQGATEEN